MSLLIDLSILALLAGTLGYAFLVDRRVRNLVRVLRDLEPVVGEFSAAVDKSEDSVTQLRSMARNLEQAPRREPAVSSAAASPEHEDGSVAFRTSRQAPERPAGVTAVTGKSDLVRGFFDTVRNREA